MRGLYAIALFVTAHVAPCTARADDKPKAMVLDPKDYLPALEIYNKIEVASHEDKTNRMRVAEGAKLEKYKNSPIQFKGRITNFYEDTDKKVYFFGVRSEWKEERGELDTIAHPTKTLFFYLAENSRPFKEEIAKARAGGATIEVTIESNSWKFCETKFPDALRSYSLVCEQTKIVTKQVNERPKNGPPMPPPSRPLPRKP